MDTAAGTLVAYKMYIDGQWVDSASGRQLESDNPYTGKPWALIPRGNAEDVDRAVRAARKAFTTGDWPKLTPSKRGGKRASPVPCAANDTLVEELEEFAAAVRGEAQPEMGGEAATRSLAVLLAGVASAREKRRVEVAEVLGSDK